MPELNSFRLDAIRRAACPYTNSQERWAEIAKRGASNSEIIHHLNREFGLGGGSGGPGSLHECHQASPPRIWIGTRTPKGKPTIQGAELVTAIRQMFSIPQPVSEGQLSLFQL